MVLTQSSNTGLVGAFCLDDFGDCDIFGGETCDCTCVESGGDLKCRSSGYDCIDPDSACGKQTRPAQDDTVKGADANGRALISDVLPRYER